MVVVISFNLFNMCSWHIMLCCSVSFSFGEDFRR